MEADAVLSYTGSQEPRYYEGLRVDKDGRICPRPRLTRREIEWLNEIGADTMLWDGSVGRYGVAFDYVSSPSSSPGGSAGFGGGGNTATAGLNSSYGPASTSGSSSPQTPRRRVSRRISIKALTPRSRSKPSTPKFFRLPPIPLTIARARELLAILSKNEKNTSSPTATAELNTALFFKPESPKAAPSGSLGMPSFVEETRFRGPPRAAATARAWEASFARPAVLATAGTVAENASTASTEGNDYALTPVAPVLLSERAQYMTARRIAGCCLRAFVDCTEALEILHAAQVATLAAAKALPGPSPASLAQVGVSIERDTFVSGALTLCPSNSEFLVTWTSITADISQVARQRRGKASDVYSRLHAAHRFLAKAYLEVEQVKRRASELAKKHEEKVNTAWKALLIAWERLIVPTE